ncbi:MAG: hypothetical protein GWN87_25030 [Desulfuromonadales bacterium]|nr:hypothetical protein [Desulfuromonadales bacterium]
MKHLELELATIADGKAIAAFNFELKRALENCLDVATSATSVREVRLVVKLKPTEDRQRASLTFQAASKIAPDAPGEDLVLFGVGGGAFVTSARQLTLDEAVADKVTELDGEEEAGGGEQ